MNRPRRACRDDQESVPTSNALQVSPAKRKASSEPDSPAEEPPTTSGTLYVMPFTIDKNRPQSSAGPKNAKRAASKAISLSSDSVSSSETTQSSRTDNGFSVEVLSPAESSKQQNQFQRKRAVRRRQPSTPPASPAAGPSSRSIEPKKKAMLDKIKWKTRDEDEPSSSDFSPPGDLHSTQSDSDAGEEADGRQLQLYDSRRGNGIDGISPSRSGKCPFCDRPLPDQPSAGLLAMLKYLKAHPKVQRRSSFFNPNALSLPAALVSTVCQRHVNEAEVIPRGIRAGYPAPGTLNFDEIPQRLQVLKATFDKLAFKNKNSNFKDKALAEVRSRSKSGNVVDEFGTFQLEQPGYYGLLGYEIVLATLEKMYEGVELTSTEELPRDFFIRRVLLPEAAVQLIIQDLSKVRSDAITILEESREYGQAAHSPMDDVMISDKARREAQVEADRLAGRLSQSSPTRRLRHSQE